MLPYFASHVVMFVSIFIGIVFAMFLNFAIMGLSVFRGNGSVEKSFGRGFFLHIMFMFFVLVSGLVAVIAVIARLMQYYHSL